MGTEIVGCGKKVDIGCKVVLWNEGPEFSFYKKPGSFKPRNWNSEQLEKNIRTFTYHHAVCYTARQTYVALLGRNLSVNFIIDDDINEDGCATIYQCLDIKDVGYSQKPLNDAGPGVEIALRPEAWQNKELYSDKNRELQKVQSHEMIEDIVHKQKLKVFKPTEAQFNACARLAYGINALCPLVNLEFPRDAQGNYLKTVVPNLNTVTGLLNHYNITTNKIDCSGFDHEYVESLAQRCKEEATSF